MTNSGKRASSGKWERAVLKKGRDYEPWFKGSMVLRKGMISEKRRAKIEL